MRKLLLTLAILLVAGTTGLAQAQDAASEDQPANGAGSIPQPADCTFTKAVICTNGSDCEDVDSLGDLPLPARFLINFEKRIMAATDPDGLPHISTIRALAHAGDTLVLQGISGAAGWTIQGSVSDGGTTFVTASNNSVLSAFGTCKAVE